MLQTLTEDQCGEKEHNRIEKLVDEIQDKLVQTMQRLVGQGNDSDLYPMNSKETLKGFKKKGIIISKFPKYSGYNIRLAGPIPEIQNPYRKKVRYKWEDHVGF